MLTVKEIQERTVPIAKKHGIIGLYLFGSYAKGNATENSDIDLRVDRPEGMSLFQLGGLQYQLSEALGVHVDVVTTTQLTEKFLTEIRKDEVKFYGE